MSKSFEIKRETHEVIIYDSDKQILTLPLINLQEYSQDAVTNHNLFEIVAAQALFEGCDSAFTATSSLAGYKFSGDDRILSLCGFLHPTNAKIITVEKRKNYSFESTFRYTTTGIYNNEDFQACKEEFQLVLSPNNKILPFIVDKIS